jgi:hypothetical protein
MSGAFCGRSSRCVSHDSEFVAKSAEIIGLCLDAPEGALVLSLLRGDQGENARQSG